MEKADPEELDGDQTIWGQIGTKAKEGVQDGLRFAGIIDEP
jgi:hypothetical protein